MATKIQKWVMPDWMEKYRQYITNTRGNPVEEMVNGDVSPLINLPLSTLQACVKSQVSMLMRMHEAGCCRRGEKFFQIVVDKYDHIGYDSSG